MNEYSSGSEYLPSDAPSSSSEITNEQRIAPDTTETDYEEADLEEDLTETNFVEAETGPAENLQPQPETPKTKQKIQRQVKSSRKRPRKPESWTRKKMALQRQKGEEYVTQPGALVVAKSVQQGILCKEKCRLKCSDKFSIEDRQLIFRKYYKLDVNSKNMIIFNSLLIQPVKRHRKD